MIRWVCLFDYIAERTYYSTAQKGLQQAMQSVYENFLNSYFIFCTYQRNSSGKIFNRCSL